MMDNDGYSLHLLRSDLFKRLGDVEAKLDMIIQALKIERRPDVADLRTTAKRMIEQRGSKGRRESLKEQLDRVHDLHSQGR